MKESHDLEFIYIIKPLKIDPPGNMMDVLAACTKYEREFEADELTDLGVISDYLLSGRGGQRIHGPDGQRSDGYILQE